MDAWKQQCADLLETHRQEGFFTQGALGVFDREGLLFTCGCGGAGAETVFDLASLTKLFTSTLLLQQAARGRIALDDPVLPRLDIPAKCPGTRRRLEGVTLRMLLTHTAGLPAWYPLYAMEGTRWDRIEAALNAEDGCQGKMVYSDLGFILAGILTEGLAGLPLAETVERGLRCPLGIEVLTYLPPGSYPAALKGRTAAVCCCDNAIEEEMCRQRGIAFDGFRPHGVPVRGQCNDGNAWYALGGISGHAGLFSDLGGPAALGRFYLNACEGVFLDAMEDGGCGRGLGFEFGPRYPRGCGHTGFTGTSLFLSRELGLGGVLLTNRLTAKEIRSTDPCRIAFHRLICRMADAGAG